MIRGNFDPRPLRRGRLCDLSNALILIDISIHAPFAGGDAVHRGQRGGKQIFQSTPPSQGATQKNQAACRLCEFQSTPPSQGATSGCVLGGEIGFISIHAPFAGGDAPVADGLRGIWISIHAPFAGGDCFRVDWLLTNSDFNPRPLRRGRLRAAMPTMPEELFQSTPLSQGATRCGIFARLTHAPISIHAPFAGGDFGIKELSQKDGISIHAPFAGGDTIVAFKALGTVISIHAPFAGGDEVRCKRCAPLHHFNPRPLRRGRRTRSIIMRALRTISIHAPFAGGDFLCGYAVDDKSISIHAPFAGGDKRCYVSRSPLVYFNPRPLRRGRPACNRD